MTGSKVSRICDDLICVLSANVDTWCSFIVSGRGLNEKEQTVEETSVSLAPHVSCRLLCSPCPFVRSRQSGSMLLHHQIN